jgi:hypothetical protein
MLKNLLIIIVLSALVVLTMPYCHTGIQGLISFHHMIINFLNKIFADGNIAIFLKQLIALLFIPLAIIAVINIIYWLFTKRWLPRSAEIMWGLWIILAVAIIA